MAKRMRVTPMTPYSGPPRTRLGAMLRYLAMRAKLRLAYRGDFLLNAAGDLLMAAVGIVFLWAVFQHVPDIVGWSLHEVLFIWGLSETAAGLFSVLFAGLWTVNQRYVLQGELDRVLLRPLDPYLQVLLDNIHLEDLPVALLGAVLVGLAASGLPPFSLAQWLLLPVFVLSGVAVLAGVLTAVSSVGFRMSHRGTTVGLVYQAAAFNRYPLDVFPRWLQLGLTVVLPFAFVAFFPATWYLGRNEWGLHAVAQPFVGAGLLAGGYALWTFAMRGYRSPGS